jgi:hypothetical protein
MSSGIPTLIDIPQSGGRFDRDGMRELQRSFPGGPPNMSLKRLAGEGNVWVAELESDSARTAAGSSTSA